MSPLRFPSHARSLSLVLPLFAALAGVIGPACRAAALPTVPPNFTIQQIGTGLRQPVKIAFTPDGRALVTERGTGQVRLIKHDVLVVTPVADFATNFCRERGLIGITVSPSFKQDHWVYVFFSQATTPTETTLADSIVDNRIVRFTMSGDTMLAGSAVVLRSLPTLPDFCGHISGDMHFAQDGTLLVTYGDGGYDVSPSLDLSSDRGKMLRLDPVTGQAAADNFFANDGDPLTLADIWAYGLRNTFDFTIDRTTGQVLGSDNSNFTEDELNRIVEGGNYGWPIVEGPADLPAELAYAITQPNYHDPIWNSGAATICPTGIVVADIGRFSGALGRSILLGQCDEPWKISRLPLGGADGLTVTGPAEDWATNFPYSVIDLEWDALGRLWVTSFPDPGFVYRIEHVNTTAVPPGAQARLALAHAGENPSRGGAAVRATVPGGPPASLAVFDVSGRCVRRLADSVPGGLASTVSWDGRDGDGRTARAGCYFVALRQGATRATLPIVLLP